jgi:methylated-DNA-protein-cysteine methyltransferase related protein
MKRTLTFGEMVRATVHRVPYGQVATYGDIAALVGNPRAARGVGTVLRELPERSDVPWWRVVASGGRISLPHLGGQLQRMLLVQEGVSFRSGRIVDLERCRWKPGGGS